MEAKNTLRRLAAVGAVCVAAAAAAAAAAGAPVQPLRSPTVRPQDVTGLPPVVFVSRAIGPGGSIYLPTAATLPGVGPHSRFDAARPGRLVVREANGRLRVLVDGARPTAASANLVDVNGPEVSYDGRRIVFAGLPQAAAGNAYGPEGYAGGWRIYVINADGTGLARLTSDEAGRAARLAARSLPASLLPFDDGDPVWLPNGGIAFSSTRWPSFAHYSGVRTSNLHTMNADGSGLRRITAERNGADRPQVDPVTGKIVFSRWWRNHRLPVDSLATVVDTVNGGYVQKDGLTVDRGSVQPRAEDMARNAWHAASIDPDGRHLAMWTGVVRDEVANHVYGGSFDATGALLANFFPMTNMAEAAGFGGVRRLQRQARGNTPLVGVTAVTADPAQFVAPGSFGVYRLGPGGMADWYAAEPAAMPDGRIVVSLARNTGQDYGLYVMNADGSGIEPLLDGIGSSELRARPVVARPLPARRLPMATGAAPALVPPPAEGPYTPDGTFEFHAHNIYFNAPVDTDVVNAPAVGSAASIRFYTDPQRQSPGSFPNLDWPVLLAEVPVGPGGGIRVVNVPANVPLFEQLRSAVGAVPIVGGVEPNGTAHVAGLNYGPRGDAALCIGCHAGHTQIPFPPNPEDTEYANLAPGATVAVSSTRDAARNGGLIDRKVLKGEIARYWTSEPGRTAGEWVRLTFAVPVRVRGVTLYNPRSGDEAESSLQVHGATVELCADASCNTVSATATAGALAVGGTAVPFADVRARAVRVRLDSVSGSFYGQAVAGLAEIEVLAKGERP